jgi:hypothetical protein
MIGFIGDLAIGLLITSVFLGWLDAHKTRGFGALRGHGEDWHEPAPALAVAAGAAGPPPGCAVPPAAAEPEEVGEWCWGDGGHRYPCSKCGKQAAPSRRYTESEEGAAP